MPHPNFGIDDLVDNGDGPAVVRAYDGTTKMLTVERDGHLIIGPARNYRLAKRQKLSMPAVVWILAALCALTWALIALGVFWR